MSVLVNYHTDRNRHLLFADACFDIKVLKKLHIFKQKVLKKCRIFT